MDLKMSIVLDVTEVILMFTQHWQVLEGHMECDGRTQGGQFAIQIVEKSAQELSNEVIHSFIHSCIQQVFIESL